MWLKEKKKKGRKKYRKRETSNSKEKNEKDRMKPIGSTWQGNWHKWKWRNLCDSKNKKCKSPVLLSVLQHHLHHPDPEKNGLVSRQNLF